MPKHVTYEEWNRCRTLIQHMFENHITNEFIPSNERNRNGFIKRLKVTQQQYRSYIELYSFDPRLISFELHETMQKAVSDYMKPSASFIEPEQPADLEFDRSAHSQWIAVPRTPEMKEKIYQLSVTIDDIIHYLSGTNLPPEERALTEIERAQLIAILETAVQLLKSPLVERTLLDKAHSGLSKAAKKAAEKQVEKGFESIAEAAIRLISSLLKTLF